MIQDGALQEEPPLRNFSWNFPSPTGPNVRKLVAMNDPRGDTHSKTIGYLGKLVTGLIWLLTGGLFGIGWLYDFCTLNRQVDECNRS